MLGDYCGRKNAIVRNEPGMEPVFRNQVYGWSSAKDRRSRCSLMLPLYPPHSRDSVSELYLRVAVGVSSSSSLVLLLRLSFIIHTAVFGWQFLSFTPFDFLYAHSYPVNL